MQQARSSETPAKAVELLSAAAACAKRHEYDQAILFLNALIDSDWQHEIALGMLAAIYAETRKPALAIECYRRVLKINPANVLARFQLSELQLAMKDPRATLQTWQPCLADRGDFLAHYCSGLASLQLDDPTSARALFNDAARHMPVDHPLHARLQELLSQLGAQQT